MFRKVSLFSEKILLGERILKFLSRCAEKRRRDHMMFPKLLFSCISWCWYVAFPDDQSSLGGAHKM